MIILSNFLCDDINFDQTSSAGGIWISLLTHNVRTSQVYTWYNLILPHIDTHSWVCESELKKWSSRARSWLLMLLLALWAKCKQLGTHSLPLPLSFLLTRLTMNNVCRVCDLWWRQSQKTSNDVCLYKKVKIYRNCVNTRLPAVSIPNFHALFSLFLSYRRRRRRSYLRTEINDNLSCDTHYVHS